MNRKIVITQTPDQRVYFTSDTHFNHNRDFIYGPRGYPNVQEMTDTIINVINKVVRPTDYLFHLGDFCLNTDESGFNELLSRIHCQNIFHVWGNHNSPLWKVYQDVAKEYLSVPVEGIGPHFPTDLEVYPLKYRNIIFIGNHVELSVDGHLFILNHYPIYVFNKMKRGAKHLCGHSHGNLDFSDQNNLTSKILDVSWDDFSRPLSVPEVLQIMNRKAVFCAGDHHDRTEEDYEKTE